LNYLDNPDCYKGYNDSIIIVWGIKWNIL
jgi:hypothetical protein